MPTYTVTAGCEMAEDEPGYCEALPVPSDTVVCVTTSVVTALDKACDFVNRTKQTALITHPDGMEETIR